MAHTKSINEKAERLLTTRMGLFPLKVHWDGDIITVARRFILKRWKRRLLGVLLLFPVVYLLSVSKSAVTYTNSTPSIKPQSSIRNSIDDALLRNGHREASSHKEVSTGNILAGMIRTNWAEMEQNGTENLFTFTSAYYDNRLDVPGRPAIVVLAYVKEFVLKPDLRCVFKYSNGSKICQKNVLAKQEYVDCLAPVYKKKAVVFKTIVCSLFGNDDSIPQQVQFSSSSSCEGGSLSGEIPVRNRAISKEVPSKRIGVCLQGTLRRGDDYKKMLNGLKNFISMSQFLGAEFITMYASPKEVDNRILNDLLVNHSGVVNLVEWKMYGYDYQFGIIYDCLYRHMHEAKYLAFFDLDEMIIPFKHGNWLDMLDDLEARGGDAHPGYSFLNRMYTRSNMSHPEILDKCSRIDKSSVYLSWFNERQCYFKHGERTKMIVSPRKIIHTHIHKTCEVVGKRKLFLVDKEFAINAHYRKKDLWVCWNYFTKHKFDGFQNMLDQYTNSICKYSH